MPKARRIRLTCIFPELPYAIETSPGKGKGMFATRDIAAGHVILNEKVAIKINPATMPLHAQLNGTTTITSATVCDLILSWHALPRAEKEAFMALHADTRPSKIEPIQRMLDRLRHDDGTPLTPAEKATNTKIVLIFITNAFDAPPHSGGGAALFLTVSRVNHSCVPNASKDPDITPGHLGLRADRDIKAGEEITVCSLS